MNINDKNFGQLWNSYVDTPQLVFVTNTDYDKRNGFLQDFAEFVPDSFIYSFANGVQTLCGSLGVKTDDNPAWLEDCVERLGVNHSVIILDACEKVFRGQSQYCGKNLLSIARAYNRIDHKNVLFVIGSDSTLITYPFHYMMAFNGCRNIHMTDNQDAQNNTPLDAIYYWAVTGQLPKGYFSDIFEFEAHHDWKDIILHLLEYKNYRLSLEEDGWVQYNPIHKQFLETFIRPFKQKSPNYIYTEELESYYKENIQPYLNDYVIKLCKQQPEYFRELIISVLRKQKLHW